MYLNRRVFVMQNNLLIVPGLYFVTSEVTAQDAVKKYQRIDRSGLLHVVLLL